MSFLFQLKLALSSFKNSAGFVFTVLITLSLTLAGLLSMMALNYVLFLKPLPYEGHDKLFVAGHTLVDEKNNREFEGNQIYSGLVHWYENQDVFEKKAILNYEESILTDHPKKPQVNTTYTTPEFLYMLGTNFSHGVNFREVEQLKGEEPVAIISYNFWQNEFSGNKDILNEKVTVAGTRFKIIGVTGNNFVEPELFQTNRTTDIWLPWSFNPAPEFVKNEWGVFKFNYFFVGKLKSEISPIQAESSLSQLLNREFKTKTAGEQFFNDHHVKSNLTSFEKRILGDNNKAALLFLLGAIALLLIASVNIGNLLLSRVVQRQRKLAIHAALGATPGNLFRNIFYEYSVLIFTSVAIAIGIASIGINLVKMLGEKHFSRMSELQIDLPIIIFAIFLGLILTTLFALVIVRKVNYEILQRSLQSSGKGTGVQVSSSVLKVMVTSQLLLCTLLIAANFNLLTESVKNITAPLGLETDNLSFLSLKNTQTDLNYDEQVQLVSDLKRKLSNYPAIEIAAQTPYNPLDTLASLSRIQGEESEDAILVKSVMTDQYYFPALETSILIGSNFKDSDVSDQSNTVIISKSIVDDLYPNRTLSNVISEKIYFKGDDTPYEIIGISENINNPRSKVGLHTIYTPVKGISTKFLLKTSERAKVDRTILNSIVQEVSQSLNVANFNTMMDVKDDMLRRDYLTTYITIFIAFLALFLALTGIYGVLSYSTLMRKAELGIRLAIGATRKDILLLIIKDNYIPLIISIAVSTIVYAGISVNFQNQLNDYIVMSWEAIFVSLFLVALFAIIATLLPSYLLTRKEAIYLLKS